MITGICTKVSKMLADQVWFEKLANSPDLKRGLNSIFTKFTSTNIQNKEDLKNLFCSFQILIELFPHANWPEALSVLSYTADQLHYLCQTLCQIEKEDTALEILRFEASQKRSRPSLILQNALYDLEKKVIHQLPEYDLKTRICPAPFETLLVSPDGSCRFCFWSSSLGNIKEQTIEDIWQGDLARTIREEMLEGKFNYCNKNICYRFRQNLLPEKKTRIETLLKRSQKELQDHILGTALPFNYELSYDLSCPYNCPSCRKEVIGENAQVLTPHELENTTQNFVNLFKKVKLGRLLLSGYGEFSSSPYMMKILNELSPEKNEQLKLHLLTSGNSSFKKILDTIPHLRGHFQRVYVSFDTLNPELFTIIRSNQNFNNYLDHLNELSALKIKGVISELIFVCTVQDSNFEEIPKLISKALELNVTEIRLKRLRQRGTFDQREFKDKDICSPDHPKSKELRRILNNVPVDSRINLIDIFFDNFSFSQEV